MKNIFEICYNAADDDIRAMIELDKVVFNERDCMSFEKIKTFYEINNEMYTIIKCNNKLIGYINCMAITPDCYALFCIGKNKDYLLTTNDVLPFRKGENYCVLTSVVLEKSFKDGDAIRILTNAFRDKIKILQKSGKLFSGLVCDCVSKDGIKYVVNNFNGKYLCDSDNCGKIYKCDFDKNIYERSKN